MIISNCNKCHGMGANHFVTTDDGKSVWKYELCPYCQGTGDIEFEEEMQEPDDAYLGDYSDW